MNSGDAVHDESISPDEQADRGRDGDPGTEEALPPAFARELTRPQESAILALLSEPSILAAAE